MRFRDFATTESYLDWQLDMAAQKDPPPHINWEQRMQQARYLAELQHQCSDQQFGQDAILHAIVTGRVSLSYRLKDDVAMIMGPETDPPSKDPRLYDTLIEEYRENLQLNREAA